jgi:hypothetical protein
MEMPEMRHLARHPRQTSGWDKRQEQDGNGGRFSRHISTIACKVSRRHEGNNLAGLAQFAN